MRYRFRSEPEIHFQELTRGDVMVAPQSKLTDSILYIGAYQPLVLARAELLRRAGFEVETAQNVREAVAAVERHPFNLILICHTFSTDDRAQIASVLETRAPHGFIMPLTKAYEDIVPDPPDILVSIVRSAVRQSHLRSA